MTHFWGPNMRSLIDEMTARGEYDQHDTVTQFADACLREAGMDMDDPIRTERWEEFAKVVLEQLRRRATK